MVNTLLSSHFLRPCPDLQVSSSCRDALREASHGYDTCATVQLYSTVVILMPDGEQEDAVPDGEQEVADQEGRPARLLGGEPCSAVARRLLGYPSNLIFGGLGPPPANGEPGKRHKGTCF